MKQARTLLRRLLAKTFTYMCTETNIRACITQTCMYVNKQTRRQTCNLGQVVMCWDKTKTPYKVRFNDCLSYSCLQFVVTSENARLPPISQSPTGIIISSLYTSNRRGDTKARPRSHISRDLWPLLGCFYLQTGSPFWIAFQGSLVADI